MNSCIYEGRVHHRRYGPVSNVFRYGLFMMFLDLEELDEIFRGRRLWSTVRPSLAWFRREDHFGDPARPLDSAVRDLVERRTGRRPAGPIRLLTHLRYFGYCFNPVSFYYCYDQDDLSVETIVAEINNTPWGERFLYVLDDSSSEAGSIRKHYRFQKAFHVSPFMDMDYDYEWQFIEPDEDLMVHMINLKEGRRMFDATLQMKRHPITGPALARLLIQYPFMTGKVVGGIYWQALRLWLKRCPFYPHPKHNQRKVDGELI